MSLETIFISAGAWLLEMYGKDTVDNSPASPTTATAPTIILITFLIILTRPGYLLTA